MFELKKMSIFLNILKSHPCCHDFGFIRLFNKNGGILQMGKVSSWMYKYYSTSKEDCVGIFIVY